jgi:hypothetical protein
MSIAAASPAALGNRHVARLVFVAVFAIAYGFALFTHHAWEDYYITYRASKNLATGQGLVFTPGQRVQSFTSPLNVLIPAGLSYLTGNESDRLVLWLFRLVSITALAAAATLLYRVAKAQGLGGLATFTTVATFAALPAVVDFSINGQETGLMMFFLALTLDSLLVPGPRVRLRLGLAWAGLMWTRPDSCVYIAALAGAFLVYNAGSACHATRRELCKTFLVAGLIAGALYLPWFAWAWWYFGSPVPHTITAKGLDNSLDVGVLLSRTGTFLSHTLKAKLGALMLIFAPPNVAFPEWPRWVLKGCQFLGWMTAVYWILPFGRRPGRAVSLALLIGVWYLAIVTPVAAAWYWPNVAILAACVLGPIVEQVGRLMPWLARLPARGEWLVRLRDGVAWRAVLLYRLAAVAIPAFCLVVLAMCACQMRVQQRVVERGNRMQIGLWLRAHAESPRDRVFLEPLGYIGYYAQLKMFDRTGLCSPEVVAARRKVSNSMARMIPELRPDWLVLRPYEVEAIRQEDPRLLTEQYHEVRRFDVSVALAQYTWIPGFDYPKFDQAYLVFHRTHPGTGSPQVAADAAKRG